jgi:hypothetical protein
MNLARSTTLNVGDSPHDEVMERCIRRRALLTKTNDERATNSANVPVMRSVVLASALLLACGRTSSDGATAEAAPLPELVSKLEGQVRWATYRGVDGGQQRSFVVDFSDFRAPAQIAITDAGRLAEATKFSPDGSRLAFLLVDRQAVLPDASGQHSVMPALVSLWLVDARRGFAISKLELGSDLPWPQSIDWIDDSTLLVQEGTTTPELYYAVDVTTGRAARLGSTMGEGGAPRLTAGKVVFRESLCRFIYWDNTLGAGVALETPPGCNDAAPYDVKWAPDGRHFGLVGPGGVTLFAAPPGAPRKLELVVPGPTSPVTYTSFDWAPGSRRFLVKHGAKGDPSFIVGDVVSELVLERVAPTPVEYGRFARDDVILLDDREDYSTWVMRLAGDGTVQSSARLQRTAWSWDSNSRVLSPDGEQLFYHSPATDEPAVYRVRLEPEQELAAERLHSVTPPGSFISFVDTFYDARWVIYGTENRQQPGSRRFLLDIDSANAAREVLTYRQLKGLQYQATHRHLPEPDAAILQAGADYQSQVFWLPLSPAREPIPMFRFDSPVASEVLQFPSRWPDAPIGP